MHIATDELYFVIDEKNKSIELTDKGIDTLTGNTDDPNFFVLPDVGSEIAELEKLLEECEGSEIMRISLQFRIDEFKEELTHFRP